MKKIAGITVANECKAAGRSEIKTVLIMSAPIGSGHVRAAAAIAEALADEDGLLVKTADIFDCFPAWAGRLLLSSYLWLLRIYPPGYEFLYKWGDRSGSMGFRSFINCLFALGANNLMKKIAPDIVITTHVTPAGVIDIYKQKYKSGLPLIGVITDYAMHKWWIYRQINAYVVPDKDILIGYERDLTKEQEIWPLGIPVHSSFCRGANKRELRRQLNMPVDAAVCLLSGGGEGLLPMEEILRLWYSKKRNKKIFFIAVSGRNECLRRQLRQIQAPGLRVLGFIDNMADYMKAADIIVSKAGGVTAAEALACGLSLIIYRPLPGQEMINAAYLTARKLAGQAASAEAVCRKLEEMNTDNDVSSKNNIDTIPAADAIAVQVKKYLSGIGGG